MAKYCWGGNQHLSAGWIAICEEYSEKNVYNVGTPKLHFLQCLALFILFIQRCLRHIVLTVQRHLKVDLKYVKFILSFNAFLEQPEVPEVLSINEKSVSSMSLLQLWRQIPINPSGTRRAPQEARRGSAEPCTDATGGVPCCWVKHFMLSPV